MSSPFAGALMITFLAPASRWARAFSASVKMPVDSRTMSTPRSPHGSAAGSFSARTLISRPSMMIERSPALDGAVVGAVGRVVLEQQGVHLGVDEVVDGDDLDVRRALDEGLERLAADAAEAVDADARGHGGATPCHADPWRTPNPGSTALRSSARSATCVRAVPREHHRTLSGPGWKGTTRVATGSRAAAERAHRLLTEHKGRPPPVSDGGLGLRVAKGRVSRRS